MRNTTILILVLILGLSFFLFGCTQNHKIQNDNKTDYNSDDYDLAKNTINNNVNLVVDDMVYILMHMSKNTPWYNYEGVDNNKDVMVGEIKQIIDNSNEFSEYPKFRYDECKYSGYSIISSGEYKDWISSGLIQCFEEGTNPELGAYWFSYNPNNQLNYTGDGHISFEVQIKGKNITVYFSANPSPVFSCPNFECFPRTFIE